MTSAYEDIYSRFYLRVEDYNIVGLEEKLVKEMMNGWLRATLSNAYVRRLFETLTIDDDVEELEYTMKFPVSDSEDQDFVEEVLAIGMVAQWLSPKYHSTLNTAQFFSNSDQKYYSQANHMAELKDMYHRAKNDLRKMIRDRGYINNSYIAET